MFVRALFFGAALIASTAQAADAGKSAFREIYREMVEIDSSPTTGS